MSKEFWKSKTFWFFLLTILVSVAGLFGFADFQPTAEQSEIVLIVVSIVGIILRFVTSKKVTV